MIFSLPWPPSANTYWRHPTRGALAGRHLISEAGRAYRRAVVLAIRNKIACAYGPTHRIGLRIDAFPPDRRRRDLDNVLKASLDAMTHAGVWPDDSQIDHLRIDRGAVEPGGRLFIQTFAITPAEPATTEK